SFFRDPERAIPAGEGAIVSPADGKVVVVTEEENAGRPGKRISIFLAVWNVHVNRSPASGTITRLDYRPGKFLAAWDPSASFQNEQNVFALATTAGTLKLSKSRDGLRVESSHGRRRETPWRAGNASGWFDLAPGWICGFPEMRNCLSAWAIL